MLPGRRRSVGLVALAVASVTSRLAWTLWLHPPIDTVASDMAGYVNRAKLILRSGDPLLGHAATLYPPGTHALLAAAWGAAGPTGGAVLWALLGAAVPVLGWLLAEEVGRARWMGWALGLLLLVWPPHLSHSGYFLSETPFLALSLAATLAMARLIARPRDGRSGGLGAGVLLALAFLVRPQIALFAALAVPLLSRRRAAVWLRLVAPGVLAATLLVGLYRVDTGQWGLVGNGPLNRAISRCSALRVEMYATAEARADAELGIRGGRSWWLEPPALRERYARVPSDHPLALRPVLGPGPVRLVGAVSDPQPFDRLARRCVAQSGSLEQARSAVVRVILLAWGDQPWPEATWAVPGQLRAVSASHRIVRWAVLPLALVGLVAVARRRQSAALLGPAHLAALVATSAFYFGSLRLRVWADPYLLLLALEGAHAAWARAQRPR